MTITELIPTVQGLSNTDKLRLLQILVQELLKAEGVTDTAALLPTSPLIGNTIDPMASATETEPLTLDERRSLLQQPLAERRRLLAEQANAMETHYNQNPEWQELMAGDIVDY